MSQHKDKVLSLCIPTNGIIEWVLPVLDSIYSEEPDQSLFEVIITDNGSNEEFYKLMLEYSKRYCNLIYKKTEAIQFLNQIEAFKLAEGCLLKFINHRMRLLPGTLKYLIDFAKHNAAKQPGVYFLNGAIKNLPQTSSYESFNEYILNLSYFSSWSAGIAIWREDFKKIDLNEPFNTLFPHIKLIFSERNKKKYIIDNMPLLETLHTDTVLKGSYNLFYAFSVEYIDIMLELEKQGDISIETFLSVKNAAQKFIAQQYLEFVYLKKPCSYDLTGADKSIEVFFSTYNIKKQARLRQLINIYKKILGRN